MLAPESMLEFASDTGVARLSAAAQRVMAKYGGGTAAARKKPSEPVLLANNCRGDAPLTDGERRAKAILMRKGWAQKVIARRFRVRHNEPFVFPAPRLRSVASARAAREALPVGLGGLVMELPEGSSPIDVTSDAGDSTADVEPAAGPRELETLWTARCEERFGEDERAFSVRLSECGMLLAAGCGDGTVRTFHARNGQPAHVLDGYDDASSASRLPVTCLRWRAGKALLVAHASGVVERWQAGSSPRLCQAIDEPGNQVYAIDVSQDGGAQCFATAGKDTAVRLYDEARMELLTVFGNPDAQMRTYDAQSGVDVGHTSRVFALRFLPGQPAVLASGGWDGKVRLWDTRSGRTVQTIGGQQHVCGDAIDVDGEQLLVGSFAARRLSIYDLRASTHLCELPHPEHQPSGHDLLKPYAARFSPLSDLIGAAGVGASHGRGEVRVFSRASAALIGWATLPHAICSLDMLDHHKGGTRIAIAGGEGDVRMLEVPAGAAEVDVS